MGYALPTTTDYVSCSRQCHLDRETPSSEPGTDYGVAYGSPLFAVEAGRVTYVRSGNHGPTGRYIEYVLDDGRTTRSLHLAETWVKPGDRVARGQQIGKTGASGNGSDWGYGAHVHQTLWPGAAWAAPTLDFELYVGSGQLEPNQRVTGPNGANGRSEPTTASPITGDMLKPGAVGNFIGWINGEVVEGNSVWFKGTSGRWFWSGGFEGGANTAGLTDLNPAPVPTNVRITGPNGANGRSEPRSTAAHVDTLGPNVQATFNGWIIGEMVEGNNVWYRGAIQGFWYWSGGFTSQSTDGLTNLNPVGGPVERTVGVNSANVRVGPTTTAKATRSLASGTTIQADGFTYGQDVEGNSIWLRLFPEHDWAWSGGFTDTSATGLGEVPYVPPVDPDPPADPNNPRNLPEYTPVYPRAFLGLDAPLGYKNDGTEALRTTAGADQHAVDPIIDTFIVHHTGTTVDQQDWFSWKNPRSSCPTWYLRTNREITEFIRPRRKPAVTGYDWNWRSIGVEVLDATGAPSYIITDGQVEEIVEMIVWIAEHDGGEIDGVPVDFKIDREHVISHQEALPGTTECPGPYIQARMDLIVEMAQALYAERHPEPGPDPDQIVVPREDVQKAYEYLGDLLDA